MGTGGKSSLTQVTGIIRGLYPAHPVKALERALGCSPRQAQRIVETGQVPMKWHAQVAAFFRQTAEFNRQRLAEIDVEIARFEEAQARARAAQDMGEDT
jgi:hypothetical protein